MKRAPIALALLCLAPTAFAQQTPAEAPPAADTAAAAPPAESRLTAETFRGLALRALGPAMMSGRISDIAVHPADRSTWYVAAGSGGVWKTLNAGTTWAPIFDDQPSYSIGCVTLDPARPETVWVGTGENVSGRHVGVGDGVYKSLDGGATWSNMGLGASEHIARILVDPRDSDTVYAAAEGPLWSGGGERGVYKSSDGGASWEQALAIGDATGVTSLEFDPQDPDTLYAAAYQRRRQVWGFLAGGPESGIYKSTDAGASWRRIENGLPKGDVGKIGLAVSPVDPRVVYATLEASAEEKGFYRSRDRGESWEKRSDYVSGGTGGHYYQEIYASPHKLDRVYQMDVWLHVTEDGGATFQRVGNDSKHSDNHAMAIDPADPGHLLAGCDGGLYETWDGGRTWRFAGNLPLTQFYKLAVDNDLPFYNVAGGTQDNNTQLGPTRTTNVHGIRTSDWVITVAADGHGCAIDPEDPNVVYSEAQVGYLNRFDKRSGELTDIKPQPRDGDPAERWNWDAPILISPHHHQRLYFGSQRLWRSDNRGDSWQPVSGDLTRAENRYELPFAGRVWSVDALYDNRAMSWYNSTTTISESPLVEGLLYVGTDDGLIQVSEDGGANWRRAEALPEVPERAYVNELKASPHDADTVYAVADDHKSGDYSPYVLKSADRGRSWTSIAGDLPERHLAWSIVEDPTRAGLLFLGTEYGIFFSTDGGGRWVKLTGGVPTISFRDLEIQARDGDLVGASFGRGFYVLDDLTPLRQVSAEQLEEEATLYSVRKTWLYVPSVPLGLPEKANMGSDLFTAANPPFGAVFTYYLRDGLDTAKARRRAGEKEIREAGGDVPFPGWEQLREEDREAAPALVLTVTSDAGEVVRRVTGPTTAGFHRVAWDLRYPPPNPTELEATASWNPWDPPPAGPLAAPGRYTVTLAKLAEGRAAALGQPQSFEVVPLSGSAEDWVEISVFQKQTTDLLRRAMGSAAAAGQAAERLRFIERALLDTPTRGADLLAEARALGRRLKDLQDRLGGDAILRRYSEPASPPILGRLGMIAGGHWNTTTGPTHTHRESFAIARRHYEEVGGALKQLIDTDLRRLEQAMEAAGAPWTPGRGAPQ